MEQLTLNQVELIVQTMADTAIANEKYFSELDGVMGDADFGVSLAGGFRAVKESYDSYSRSSIGDFLLGVAGTITGNTGGCSGPVWGTLFMRTGMAFKGRSELEISDIITGLKSAIEGISKRGGAVIGDKTMLDALNAIVVSLEGSANTGDTLIEAFEKAADAAYEMREISKDWVAKRGRQSFTGDRSRGTYDPGIIAVGDMAKNIAGVLKQSQ